ncbi:hypothetical protein ACFL9S_10770 [Erwinia sp. AnSW2-5]|uniref:hypothetical protein n=1 Tax=Erwinia sp. AnSW2-5 TaxID=3367692 RepID=UPI00385BF960
MDKDFFVNFIEVTLALVGALTLIKKLPCIRISYNHLIFISMLVFIAFIAAFNTNGEYLFGVVKLAMCCFLIYFSYHFSRYSPMILVFFLIACSIQSFFVTGHLDKFSFLPVSFISLILVSVYSKGDNLKGLLVLCILIDVLQSVYTSYRGQILFCILAFFCIFLKFSIKRRMTLVFVAVPLSYLSVMYLLGLYFFSYREPILSATSSNIERSSMIYWGVNKFYDFLVSAPTVTFFQENAGQYKAVYLMNPAIPNDPHSFLIMLFVFFGFIPTVMIFLFLIRMVSKTTQRISFIPGRRADFVSLAFLQAIIIFSMHPFNSFSRVFFSLTFGVFLAFGSGKYFNEVQCDDKQKD